MRYPVNLIHDRETGNIDVSFPDIPEALTFGTDREHALAMAADALESALDFYFDDNRPVPMPSPADGRPTVELPASVSARVLQLNEALGGVRQASTTRSSLDA